MKTALRVLASFAMVCLVASAASAADGVLIASKVTSNGGAPETTEAQIEKTRVRAETIDPTGNRTVVMFDGSKNVLHIIDMGRKSYMELTKAQMEQMGQQIQQMMAQMDAAMANMPPAQRAQMEAMMRGRGGAGGGMAGMITSMMPTYKKTGTDTVGKWTCDKYEGFTNGQKTAEMCTVSPSAFGLVPADFTVLQQIADMMKTALPPQMASAFQMGPFGAAGVDGIPVKSTTNMMGRESTTEVTAVSRKTFPETIWQIPAGFTKQDMPMMGGRGR